MRDGGHFGDGNEPARKVIPRRCSRLRLEEVVVDDVDSDDPGRDQEQHGLTADDSSDPREPACLQMESRCDRAHDSLATAFVVAAG